MLILLINPHVLATTDVEWAVGRSVSNRGCPLVITKLGLDDLHSTFTIVTVTEFNSSSILIFIPVGRALQNWTLE